MKKQKMTKHALRALQLNETEKLRLSWFLASNYSWVVRHVIPLETVLRRSLHRQRIELLRIQQIEPHPVYELFLRLGRSGPATKSGIEMAVRRAFAEAGRCVTSKFAHAQIKGDRARTTVLVDS